MYIYIYIYIYLFIGSASAADLYFCVFVYCKYGCWGDLVDGIGFAAQFDGRMHVSKADLLDFEIPCFLEILLIVSDSLYRIWTPISGFCCVLKGSKRRGTKNHAIWRWNFV